MVTQFNEDFLKYLKPISMSSPVNEGAGHHSSYAGAMGLSWQFVSYFPLCPVEWLINSFCTYLKQES